MSTAAAQLMEELRLVVRALEQWTTGFRLEMETLSVLTDLPEDKEEQSEGWQVLLK